MRLVKPSFGLRENCSKIGIWRVYYKFIRDTIERHSPAIVYELRVAKNIGASSPVNCCSNSFPDTAFCDVGSSTCSVHCDGIAQLEAFCQKVGIVDYMHRGSSVIYNKRFPMSIFFCAFIELLSILSFVCNANWCCPCGKRKLVENGSVRCCGVVLSMCWLFDFFFLFDRRNCSYTVR